MQGIFWRTATLFARKATASAGGDPTPTKIRFVTKVEAARLLAQAPPAQRADFRGKPGQVMTTYTARSRSILVGVGKRPTMGILRRAVQTGMRHARTLNVEAPRLLLPCSKVTDPVPQTSDAHIMRGATGEKGGKAAAVPRSTVRYNLALWARLGGFEWTTGRTKPKQLMKYVARPSVPNVRPMAARRADIVADCVNNARTWVNLRPDVATPAYMSRAALDFAGEHSDTVRVVSHLVGSELQAAGLHLLHGVGAGSAHAPELLVLEYRGASSSSKGVALVGKGVVMDTGGLNIKPYGSMETMHMDMAGAAACLGAFQAAVRLRLPVNVVCALGLVENAVGPAALRPSTIVKSLKGLTVEVTNTDAEGRLVLADALTYVQRHARATFKPTEIIDVATLTGAMVVALGNQRAGIFSTSPALMRELVAASRRTQERVWPMPIDPEHHKAMQGGLSDLINCAPGRFGGACSAAAFLQRFVQKDMRWAHIDVAGPAMGEKATETSPAGAPGFGVQLLVDYLANKKK
jgi:leucyl aminopeptidase